MPTEATPSETVVDLLDRRRDKDQLKTLRSQVRELEQHNLRLIEQLSVLEKVDSLVPAAPNWRHGGSKGRLHRARPALLLSDTHFDEVVNPDEVEGVNEYNRDIAVGRLKRTLSGTVEVSRKYLTGLNYDGFVLMLGGDLLSGSIHEELEQTNEDTVLGSVDFWAGQLIAFVGALADEFERVHVAAVVGNHGRLTRKPRCKLRVRDNLDWLIYRVLLRAFEKDSRITWQIPESADCTFNVYDTVFRLTHGDQFHGGSGAAGMLAPLMLGNYRKSQRQSSIGRPYQHLVMGHWHTYFVGKGLVVNGSLKGYDEYAYLGNFSYERPQQAFWITTPQNGVTINMPIFSTDKQSTITG